MQLLLNIKSTLQTYNPIRRGNYAGWRSTDQDPCSWPGVTCAGGRVTALDMSNSLISCNLSAISPSLGNLTALERLDLSQNFLKDVIPSDLHGIQGLRYLNLSHNLLSGPLLLLPGLAGLKELDLTSNRLEGDATSNFPEACGELVLLNISANNFTGDVRTMFERCPKLRYLDISTNRFTGELWPGVASFREFCASENNLSGLVSPDTFPASTAASQGTAVGCALEALDLSQNQLQGEFPASISNCRALRYLNIWGNDFNGTIPSSIGQLSELEGLHLGNNRFDREIPPQLLNLSRLDFLDLSKINFSGDIQPVLGRFVHVRFLLLHGNNYTGGIQKSGILGLPSLERLDLSYNQFSGELPREILSMRRLKFLILAYNKFSGSIPPEFGTMTELQALDLSYNRLTGSIPPSIGNLTSLLWLMLGNNSLTGEIPTELGNCRSLLWFNLANNRLSGALPPALFGIGSDPLSTFQRNRKEQSFLPASGECLAMRRWIPASYPPFNFTFELLNRKNCRTLWDRLLKGYGIIPVCAKASPYRSLTISGYIQVTGNRLSGSIPPEIGLLRNFSLLHLDQNAFTGKLPPEIAKLPLGVLNVSRNNLSGPIPREIGDMLCLQNLDLSVNNFSGDFPGSDFNRLSELSHFNVSYNPFLTGEVPRSGGQMSTFTNESFLGDPLLVIDKPAGGASTETYHHPEWRRRKPRRVAFLVFLGFSCTFLALGIVALLTCLRIRPPPVTNQPDDDDDVMCYHCSSDSKHCVTLTVADLLSQKEHAISLSSSPSTVSNATAVSDIVASSTNSGCGSSMSTIVLFRLDKSAAFTYADILRATDGFSENAMLGRGGSGMVYHGVLPDGRQVAVKQLQREGPEGEKEFRAEMEVLTRFGNSTSGDGDGGWTPHPNLVPMLGWCLAGSKKLLVYEYMEGGSLDDLITDWGRLDPEQRLETALGVAQALAFLHHECRPAVVHRDVKASNVLLDGVGRARVTDFGLARVVRPEETHVSTVVAGTVGYVAPEYGQTWQATPKGDVYSFGVLVMELATGRRALDGEEEECLVERVRRKWANKEEAEAAAAMANVAAGEALMMGELLKVGVRCTAEAPQARPNMKEVLAMLLKIRRTAHQDQLTQ